MHVAIVAGEASGDILGAGLIAALRQIYPDAHFSGIGGPRMIAEGFHSLFDMERLSVMGIVDPLKRLPELLSIRRRIKRYCLLQPVDVFIGIDSPDFTLNIERFLKKRGIATVHYVSPSVWAWRQGRIHGIRKSVDLMLTLLPFEAEFYQRHQVPVCFVGHPLADQIAMQVDVAAARQQLGIAADSKVVALMPGSRRSEVALLGDLFLQVANHLQQDADYLFVLPAANRERLAQLQQLLAGYPALQVRLLDGQSHLAMAAADAVLLASGTTALEAMLFKKPMVVAYRMAPLSFAIISRLVKTAYVSLPNLLAGRQLVPELIQDQATVANLVAAMQRQLHDRDLREALVQAFCQLHQSLRADASATAAKAIEQLLCKRST